MNYGEEFIETYNNSFINLKKDYKKFLKDNFEADETFPIIFERYVSKLYDLQHAQYSKDNLLIKCWEEFLYRFHKYNKNAARNIIDKNILQIFEKNKSNHSSKITDFSNFVDSLAKLSIAKDFEHRIKDDIKDIEKAFLSKNISAILKVEKQVSAEYLVSHARPIEKFKKEVTNLPKKENKSKTPNNPFTMDEKFILIHYMLKHERVKTTNLSTYEITLILKITNDCFANKKIEKKKDTDYEKLHKGYKYYSKTLIEKKELMSMLIEKVNQYSFTAFTQYLSSELHKL
jgi:hypothetical protein